MAKDLDAQVADFRHRPLDEGSYTFLAADAWPNSTTSGRNRRHLGLDVLARSRIRPVTEPPTPVGR